MSNLSLSVTTTELARPEVIKESLESFKANIIGLDFSQLDLIANIDPVPSQARVPETINLLKQYFKSVMVKVPTTPNQIAAVQYVWSTAQTDIIFHYEMDWILTRKLDWNEMYNYFLQERWPKMNLRAYLCPAIKGYMVSLNPGLLTKDCYKHLAANLDANKKVNVERQFTRYQFKYGIKDNGVWPVQNDPKNIIIRDIGQKWLETQNLRKPFNFDEFTAYPTISEAETEVKQQVATVVAKKEAECQGCKKKKVSVPDTAKQISPYGSGLDDKGDQKETESPKP